MKRSFAAGILAALALSLTAAESPYGVCAHLNRMPQEEMRRELAGIAATGIGFVRTDLDWAQVEPQPGKWDFSRWDALVGEAEKQGVSVLAILGGELPAHGKPPFRNMERWLNYVEQCVSRYKGRIDSYEVINEADCDRPWGEKPNPANYAQLLRETFRTIRRIDPDARVLFSGMSDFGNPMEFVEQAFRAGAVDCFDVMNFHPYQWRNVPESQLPLRIRDLRNLMRKYGIDKPIWITEIGDSSAPERFLLARETVPAALKLLGFSPERDCIGVLSDTPTLYCTGSIDDYLPGWKHRKELSFQDLAVLDVSKCPILALPGREGFPASQIDAVVEYVRRGGTLILPGGLPFYFDFSESEEEGLFRTVQIDDALLPKLHLGWEAFWVKPEVPRTTTATEAGEAFPSLTLTHRPGMRFLNMENLKGNDRMIPIALGVNGSYRMPVAALFRLDSDLKGNIIAVVDSAGTDSFSELEQTQRLPRQLLLAFSEDVEKVFYYRFRAGEWNNGREAHFGILHRDFTDKPARLAYRSLIRNLPPGSTKPVITGDGRLRQARWIRPDGRAVTALWTAFGTGSECLRETAGEAETLTGEKIPSARLPEKLTPSILYLTGEAGQETR